MKMLTPELLRDFASAVIKFAEDAVLGSKSTVDDRLVLPVLKTIRVAFDIKE